MRFRERLQNNANRARSNLEALAWIAHLCLDFFVSHLSAVMNFHFHEPSNDAPFRFLLACQREQCQLKFIPRQCIRHVELKRIPYPYPLEPYNSMGTRQSSAYIFVQGNIFHQWIRLWGDVVLISGRSSSTSKIWRLFQQGFSRRGKMVNPPKQ